MNRRTYVTAKRVGELLTSLSELDLSIIGDVARVNVMKGRQIRQLHFGDSDTDRRMARLHLKTLNDRRVLTRLSRRIGGQRSGSDGFVYALDVAGQRLVRSAGQRSRPPWTPEAHQLAHALGVSQLYVELRQLESPDLRLTEFDAEPACWRRYYGPGGSPLTLKPDAYVVTTCDDFDDCFFIEVDRSTEASTRIAAKLKAYLAYFQSGREQAQSGVFPRVVWSVPSHARRSQIVEVIAEQPADYWPLFVVALSNETAGLLTGSTNERR